MLSDIATQREAEQIDLREPEGVEEVKRVLRHSSNQFVEKLQMVCKEDQLNFQTSPRSGSVVTLFVTILRRQYDMIESRMRETSTWIVETFSPSQ